MTSPHDPIYVDDAAEQAVEELAGRITRQMDEHLHGMKSMLRRLEALPDEVDRLKDEMVTAVLVHQRSEALANQIDGATRGLARSAQVVELQESIGTVQSQLHQIAGGVAETRSALQRLAALSEERERALRESNRVLAEQVQRLEGTIAKYAEHTNATVRANAQALSESLETVHKELGDQLRALPRTDEIGPMRRIVDQVNARQERFTQLLWAVVGLEVAAVAVGLGILLTR